MECLTKDLGDFIMTQNSNLIEEVDIIESVINVNERNLSFTKEKVLEFLEKRNDIGSCKFIVNCIIHSYYIRPKSSVLISSILSAVETMHEIRISNDASFCSALDAIKNVPQKVTNSINSIKSAIYNDNVDILQRILVGCPDESNIVDIENFIDENILFYSKKVSLLEASAFYGSVNCFKYLLLSGEEITEICCRYAIAGGNCEIVRIIDHKDIKFDDNCLATAATYHHYELFHWLNNQQTYTQISLNDLIECFNIPLFCFYSLQTKNLNDVLHIAIKKCFLGVVEFLLDNGVEIESRDNELSTPLITASEYGNTSVVKLLINKGANINAKDSEGFTPLIAATENGYFSIVDLLLKSKCNVNERNNFGETAADIAKLIKRKDILNVLFFSSKIKYE